MKAKAKVFRKKNIKKQEISRRRRYSLWIGAALLMLSALGWSGFQAAKKWDLFFVEEIRVLGNPQTLTADQIIEKSGLKKGQSLFAVSLYKLRDRLREYDFFKNVVVYRQWPHTIAFEVQEYTPAFILNTGRLYYVDTDGEIFRDISGRSDAQDLPIVSGLSEDSILREPAKTREVLKQAYQLLQRYSETAFASRYGLSEVHFDKNLGFTLYPEKTKYCIRFGNREFEDKLSKLMEFWNQSKEVELNLSSIDLNYPGKILTTL